MYDLIIIGAGPAGITAAVYAARKQINFCVISEDVGGQTAWSGEIENYTGYQFISGPDLVGKFEEHLNKFGIELKENESVKDINKYGGRIFITTNKGSYETKTAIIASGKKSKELKVPGEAEYKNKGLTYCATCDAPFFRGKKVAVIGGGNSALDAAIQLIKIAEHIYIINVAAELTGDPIMQDKVKNSSKVTIMNDAKVTAIEGEKMVKAIKLEVGSEKVRLPVEGVFVEIGLKPNSEFAKDIEKNERGEIKITPRNETNIPGIFAAGDVTDVPEKQIIIAAGEGSKAALSAYHYLIRLT